MIHVVNWKYADIGTAVAGANMAQQGMVCKVTASGANRVLTPISDTEDALINTASGAQAWGNYAVAMKVDTDAFEVDGDNADGLTIDRVLTGDRRVKISNNDLIMEVRRGAKIEYSADLLDASLDPARSGATPAVGDQLGIKGSLWSTFAAATPTGIQPAPAIARVHKVHGTNVVIELV